AGVGVDKELTVVGQAGLLVGVPVRGSLKVAARAASERQRAEVRAACLVYLGEAAYVHGEVSLLLWDLEGEHRRGLSVDDFPPRPLDGGRFRGIMKDLVGYRSGLQDRDHAICAPSCFIFRKALDAMFQGNVAVCRVDVVDEVKRIDLGAGRILGAANHAGALGDSLHIVLEAERGPNRGNSGQLLVAGSVA